MVERVSPFFAPVEAEANGVRLSAVPRGALWQIAAWPDTFADVQAKLVQACGVLTPGPGEIASKADARLIRVEPLKWWVMGPDGMACPVDLGSDQGAITDLAHDQAAIALDGPASAEILKRMVSLDLRDAAFPSGQFATTEMHHMITRVLRADRDGPHYEVMVMRSYADNLAEIVQHHLDRFG